MLILPIHKHCISLHLFVLSSISFISVLFTVFQVQVFFSPEFSLLTDFIFDENINDIVVFLSEISTVSAVWACWYII